MKITTSLLIAAALLSWAPGAAAQPRRSDYSGNWVMDTNRSFTGSAGLQQSLAISHSGNDLKLDARLITPQGEREVHETWVLDGQQREAEPASGAAPGSRIKRQAHWLPDERRFVLTEETTSETPKGPTTQTVTRKFSLSADGETLTVDYYIDRPQISGESKRIFVRRRAEQPNN